jgi:hypothetical protein
MITKLARLEFELYTKPSNSDFIGDAALPLFHKKGCQTGNLFYFGPITVVISMFRLALD